MPQQNLYTLAQALEYAERYCSRQEHCQSEVRDKLKEKGLDSDIIEECIAELICEGFINESRYADLFAVSKFHQNKWGRKKIALHLKWKEISSTCIRHALNAIEQREYSNTIAELFEKKAASLKGEKPHVVKQKTITYLMGKGFEYDEIINSANDLKDDSQDS